MLICLNFRFEAYSAGIRLYCFTVKNSYRVCTLDTNIVAGSVSYLDKIYHKKRPNRDVLKAFWKEMDPQ